MTDISMSAASVFQISNPAEENAELTLIDCLLASEVDIDHDVEMIAHGGVSHISPNVSEHKIQD